MKDDTIEAPRFHDEDKAREYLEKLRWRDGVECPHCGTIDKHYSLTPRLGSKEPVRKGVWKCRDCRKQFSITVGTIFERSHIPLSKWLLAVYLLCSSKKGMSALQLSRMLRLSYKSAWFMAHRIRHAMAHTGLFEKMKGVIEVDEAYIGGKEKGKGYTGRSAKKKTPVVALIEREGRVRSMPVERVTGANLKGFIRENVDKSATIMTDEFRSYSGLHKEYAKHEVVNHGEKQYVRGNAHTNTVEGYFSLLKRGIIGVYHHVNRKHLNLYCAEFDYRYNSRKITDMERTDNAILKGEGKRLTYS